MKTTPTIHNDQPRSARGSNVPIRAYTWRICSLLIAFLLISSAPVLAQQTVRGTVVDSENGEPLPGVNVVIKGTLKGQATDVDGRFELTLESGESILVFSFTGFETQEIDVTGRNDLLVELVPADLYLDELVVIGYGAVRKRDLTGAVSSVRSGDIGKTTSLNAEQALQGRVSGLTITTTSGAPGASAAVRIRGVGTFNNASPIYVVDGVILDDISFLNPADIQSMEVLKDASATAIYGSRGANGVILVTTRAGSATMDRPVVNFSTEYGFQQVERTIDLLDGRQFAIISNEIRSGTYNNVDAVPNTDWQDLIFDIAPIQTYQVSVAGSSEKTDYYASIGYFNQQGIIDQSSFERLTLKLNNTYRITSTFKLGNNLTFAPYTQTVAPNVVFAAYRAQPVLPPYYDDGSFGVVYNVGNPLASLAYSNNENSGVRVVGNLFAELLLNNEWLIRSSFGTDAALNRGLSFTPAYTIFNPDGSPSQQQNEFNDLSKAQGTNYTWLFEQTVNWSKQLDRHSINAVAGFTMQQTRSEDFRLAGQNILRDGRDFWYVLPNYIIDEANNINMLNSIYNGADLVETSFMAQGLITVRQYLDAANPDESQLVSTINELLNTIEWDWFTRDGQNVLYWHWSPDKNWTMNMQIKGYNEGLITYLLAASSENHGIDPTVYHNGWASNGGIRNGRSFYGVVLPVGYDYGGPLFFAHYSFLGLDPRNLRDRYANYWTQNRAHTLINRAHALANPGNYVGYSADSWGFTASDNPSGYLAHEPTRDNGTITPTAALSSMPFTPEESMQALRHFYFVLGDKLWGEYGFYDAFNPTQTWWARSYLAIDQGPIIIMIENHRTGLLWDLFMSAPEVQRALDLLEFEQE